MHIGIKPIRKEDPRIGKNGKNYSSFAKQHRAQQYRYDLVAAYIRNDFRLDLACKSLGINYRYAKKVIQEPEVASEINRRVQLMIKDREQMEARIAEKLLKIIEGDIGSIVDHDGELLPANQWPAEMRSLIESPNQPKLERMKALRMLGDMLQLMNKSSLDITSGGKELPPVSVNFLPNQEPQEEQTVD